MHEKRQHPRSSAYMSAIISHPSFRVTVKIIDISAGGLSVDMSNMSRTPVGTIVDVIIKKTTGKINEQAVAMRVMHVQANGRVGLAFV